MDASRINASSALDVAICEEHLANLQNYQDIYSQTNMFADSKIYKESGLQSDVVTQRKKRKGRTNSDINDGSGTVQKEGIQSNAYGTAFQTVDVQNQAPSLDVHKAEKMSIGKQTSIDYINKVDLKKRLEEPIDNSNISAQAPKRRIVRQITSEREIDSKTLTQSSRFVQIDRRGTLKKYHKQEERSMREKAAIKA